jgi:hypothetical protein
MLYTVHTTERNQWRARESMFHVDGRKEIKKTNGKAKIRRPNNNERS